MGKHRVYDGFLAEDLREQLKTIMEMLDPLTVLPAKIDYINERLDRMEEDNRLFKLVIKDLSETVNNHETRLIKLESPA
ncbi:MAG TPA: hypothetical protein VG992_00410 [Candidatus Saccharimonadales bacterium]|nr:hypothetical protein [Candidatus Saccharimonadales bacterium]